MYDLGFDASEGYHTYGFDWQKDSITWYVDGKAVYTATQQYPVYCQQDHDERMARNRCQRLAEAFRRQDTFDCKL